MTIQWRSIDERHPEYESIPAYKASVGTFNLLLYKFNVNDTAWRVGISLFDDESDKTIGCLAGSLDVATAQTRALLALHEHLLEQAQRVIEEVLNN